MDSQRVIHRIDCGGSENFADEKGVGWSADYGYNVDISFSTVNNISISNAAGNSPNSISSTVYISERYNQKKGFDLQYSLDVPYPGIYYVALHFAEICTCVTKAGDRVQDIIIEGQLVFPQYDTFARVGFQTADILAYAVPVLDGALSLNFSRVAKSPKINAIEVVASEAVNFPPQFISVAPSFGYDDEPFVYRLKTLDETPQDLLSYRISIGPAEAFLNRTQSSAFLMWDPPLVNQQEAPFKVNFEIEVFDTANASTKQGFDVQFVTRKRTNEENGSTTQLPNPKWVSEMEADIPRMPIDLGEVAAAVIKDELYVVGNGNPATLKLNLSNPYSSGNGWNTTLAERPYPGDHHHAIVVEGKLLLLGGLGGGSQGKMQLYNPNTDSWELLANMPWPAGAVSAAVIRDRVFVCGGITFSYSVSNCGWYSHSQKRWGAIASLPRRINHAASGTDGEKFYIFGGRDSGNFVNDGLPYLQIYDPSSNTWRTNFDEESTLPQFVPPRGGMGPAVFMGNVFYIIGGETLNGDGATAQGVFNTVNVYDPSTETFSYGPSLPTARHGIFPVIYENKIIVVGGGSKNSYSQSSVVECLQF